MNNISCTIYDCEFDLYYEGLVKDNIVYKLDKEENIVPAKEYVCDWISYDMVQFYIGYCDNPYVIDEKDNLKWGYFQLSTGKVIVPPVYDYAFPFYGDRARVEKNMKYGFIDPKGKEVVEIMWNSTARSFTNVLCWVKEGDKFGYIDKNGVVVLHPQFEVAENFEFVGGCYDNNKYAALVKKDGKYGFIDEKGNYIFQPKFDYAKRFWSKGYAPVMVYEKWAFIDISGEFVTALEFDEAGEEGSFEINENIDKKKTDFSEQYVYFYTVKKDTQWGIMDSNFNIIMPEPGVNYLVHKGIKLYIKEGRVTSKYKIKFKKAEKENV